MAVIGIRELTHHTSRVIARVRAGETIEVTDRGTPVLTLVPHAQPAGLRAELIASGRLTPAATPGRLPDPIEIEGIPAEVSLADELIASRDDEERW
ncbi:prevent-host-death family protein [Sinosporangium album]|uniref:Prevent-host-death family protein n=1 Tax=Sinosporangium album TaxID=504805 RepID=A0A1G7X914_9ACTN|nr:type II toxin-antitoxin system prevent-host-death family antitoxin [Sinosporangium album]SDG80060.1 prevent-host-death family protein [Sinosporangium album]